MSEERKRVLAMLAEGKVSVDEAERLLRALEETPDAGKKGSPRFLRVVVEGEARVNVRVPLKLLRSGIRLSSLLPKEAKGKVDGALGDRGLDLDLRKMKPEEIDAFIETLNDLTVDVDDGKDKVRVFCE